MTATRRSVGVVAFALGLPWRHRMGALVIAGATLVAGGLDSIGLALVVPTIGFLVGTETLGGDVQVVRWIETAFEAVGLTFTLRWIVVVLFAVMGLRSLTLMLQYWLMARFQARYEGDVKTTAFEAIMRASWPFFLRQRAGTLTNALTAESGRAAGAFGALNEMIGTLMNVLIYLGLAFAVSWKLTFATVAATIALLATFIILSRIARRLGAGVSEVNANLLSNIDESLLGAKVVKSEASEGLVESRFQRLVWRRARVDELMGVNRGVYFSVSELAFLALLVGGLLLGTRIMDLPAATMLLFALLFLRIVQRARVFQGAQLAISGLLPAVDVVSGITADAQASREAGGERTFDQLRSGIEFKDVTFGYGGGEPVLRGASLSVPASSMAALVGPSGVGKTTVIDLTIGLLRPTSGCVLVDGHPLDSYAPGAWRSKLAYVSQETILFNDSVRGNIARSRPDATEAEVREAAMLARADEFIQAMPEGYDTVIGDRGMRVSGGQRQRLALARALLRRPELLILDEATSELDTEAEASIQASIEGIRGQMTILVVAHRLSTVLTADVLHVLDDGRIVESGSASELLARRGVFSRLYEQTLIGSGSSVEPTRSDRPGDDPAT